MAMHSVCARQIWRDDRKARTEASKSAMTFSKESGIIAAIGILDLLTTLVWIHHYGAHEANPLFRFFLQQGVPAFVAAKALFLAGPLWALEWARLSHARFVLSASRVAIIAYLVLYGAGVAALNNHPGRADTSPIASISEGGQAGSVVSRMTGFPNKESLR